MILSSDMTECRSSASYCCSLGEHDRKSTGGERKSDKDTDPEAQTV